LRSAHFVRHPRESGDPVTVGVDWVPAFAGMTRERQRAPACPFPPVKVCPCAHGRNHMKTLAFWNSERGTPEPSVPLHPDKECPAKQSRYPVALKRILT